MLKQPCPKCGESKLLEGPFYEREKVRCQHCGAQFKVVKK